MISSIKRRGVLLALVILPNGSRSLIPAAWTDWRNADASPGEDDMDCTSSLGKLGDLLQLGKIIDALLSRHAESAPHVESSHAAEPGVSRPSATATDAPAPATWEQLDEAARLAALGVLARLIARMLAAAPAKENDHE